MASDTVRDVQPGEAQGLIDQGWRLVDVRTDAEWAQGRVAGAHHVPMDQVVEQIGAHTEHPLLIMCASGGRSYRVAQYLVAQGIEAANLDGGIHAWEDAGLPVER